MNDIRTAFCVQFEANRRGPGLIASPRINGRIAFPDRFRQQPSPNVWYLVTIPCPGASLTAYFLDCLRECPAGQLG